jgi:hypothetical protein
MVLSHGQRHVISLLTLVALIELCIIPWQGCIVSSTTSHSCRQCPTLVLDMVSDAAMFYGVLLLTAILAMF